MVDTSAPPAMVDAGSWRRDLGAICLLLLLVAGLRAWILTHTVVPARDTIGYIRYALEFENFAAQGDLGFWETWQEVLTKNHQHPGYPLSVLAVSLPVRAWYGGIDPDSMRLSAQLASTLAAVLLVLPMFFLGKTLFDRGIAFWGTLLFHALPGGAHLLSDGLSESLFLLFSVTALLFAVQAARGQSAGRFALCGVFAGLAYLTRPEGALILAAAGVTLVGMQCVRSWRRPWRRFLACGLSLTIAGLLVSAPYWTATGSFTNKPSVKRLLAPDEVTRHQPPSGEHEKVARGDGSHTLFASIWGAVISKNGSGWQRLASGVGAVFAELFQGFHYIGGVFVLLGLWWCWPRLRGQPGFWLLVVFAGIHTAGLCFLVVHEGYVSDRHVLVLVLFGCYFLAAGLRELPARVRQASSLPIMGRQAAYPTLLMVLMVVACLPKTLQPLHRNRAGHQAAGLWLAEHLQPGDVVRDDHCWSHYYAGQVFQEGKTPAAAPGHEPVHYFVLTRSQDAEVADARGVTEARIQAAAATEVYHWPLDRPVQDARVIVYAVSEENCHAHKLLNQRR